MSLDELPVEILDSAFGLIFDEFQMFVTTRRRHQPTVSQPSDQYDPLTLRLVCSKWISLLKSHPLVSLPDEFAMYRTVQ